MKLFNLFFGSANRKQILEDAKDWHELMSENDNREVSKKEALSVMFYNEIGRGLMPITAMIMGLNAS